VQELQNIAIGDDIMQKWEYESANIFINTDKKTRIRWGNEEDLSVDQMLDLFNKKGKEGWELVCVEQANHRTIFWFKRQMD